MGPLRRLGDLESVLMQILWSADAPATVREVLGRMDRIPPLAYTTVLTVMDNLHRKGFLQRSRVGRAFEYWPTKQRAEYTAELMEELLNESGDRSATLLRFAEHMTPAELSRLKETLGD